MWFVLHPPIQEATNTFSNEVFRKLVSDLSTYDYGEYPRHKLMDSIARLDSVVAQDNMDGESLLCHTLATWMLT